MTIFDEIAGSPIRHEPPDYDATPTTPTTARPGTPEKLAEFRRRINAGEDLWHEDDMDLRTISLRESPEDEPLWIEDANEED